MPEAHTFIMCTATDDRGKGCLGWFVDILICPLNKTYSAETYRRSETYGGIWEVFTNTTHGEMLTRRSNLRGATRWT